MCSSDLTNEALYGKLNYDPQRDLAPVAIMARFPLALVVNTDLSAGTVTELIALARAKPGSLSFGSAGIGASGHLAGEMFKSITGIDAVHVPYKGAYPAATDVAAGQIQFQFAAHITVQGLARTGKLRMVAVTSAKRSPVLPELPTVAEAGLAGFEVLNWFGVLGPARLPGPVVARLHRELAAVMALTDTRERLAQEGNEAIATTPEEFDRFIRSEIAKWAKLVKAANMKAD